MAEKAILDKCVVVIPSLAPSGKLKSTVGGLYELGFRSIVVVDDGSGEKYLPIFKDVENSYGIHLLHHERNFGKGRALRTAYSYIKDSIPGASYIVTADSDGQHLPKDIYACCKRLSELGDDFSGMVLGSRDFSLPDVPPKSKNGNKITCFVFRAFCGICISDTQTGLRAFRREDIDFMLSVPGDRYEYETNVLLKMKRAKMAYEQVTIETVYEDNNSCSHYRPFRDSFRIYRLIFRHMLGLK